MNLQQYMVKQFGMADLEVIAHDVGLSFHRIQADSIEATVANLLAKVTHYGRYADLITVIKTHQPDFDPGRFSSGLAPPAPAARSSRPQRRRPSPRPAPARKPPAAARQQKKGPTLQEFISNYFNLEEVETICFELGVDFEQLGGRSKSAKVRELIIYMMRRRQLPQLITAVREARPKLDMSAVVMPDQSWLEKQKYSDRRILALAGIIVMMMVAILSYVVWLQLSGPPEWATNEVLPEEVFGVAVAEFTVGGDKRQAANGRETSLLIYEELGRVLLDQPELRGRVALTKVGPVRTLEEAQLAGRVVNADVVLWGWMPETAADALYPNFTLVEDEEIPESASIYDSVNVMISGPNTVRLTQMSGRTSAISRLLLGLAFMEGETPADYQKGLDVFLIGVQELETELANITALIEQANDLEQRLGLIEIQKGVEKTLAIFHTAKGVAHAALSQPAEALASYESALTLDNTYPRLHAALGNYYYSLRQYDQANSHFEQMLLLEPNNPKALYGLGIVFYETGNYDLALDRLDQSIMAYIASGEESASAYLAKGYVLVKLGRMDEAALSFQVVVNSPLAQENLRQAAQQEIQALQAVGQEEAPEATAVPTQPVAVGITKAAPPGSAIILEATQLPTPAASIGLSPTPLPTAAPGPIPSVTPQSTQLPTLVPTPPLQSTQLPTLAPTATLLPTLLPTAAPTATLTPVWATATPSG